jgi:chromosome transmission fidelity protein 1
MRAVNQSIGKIDIFACHTIYSSLSGRAIRHKDDYAVILLLDKRYANERIRSKLPGWISKRLVSNVAFGIAFSQTATFFRTKRQAS